MAPPTPRQVRMRSRVELLIRLLAPAFDLVLAAGDRLSRVVDRNQLEEAPLRAPHSVAGAPRRPARRALEPGFERGDDAAER